MHKKLLLFAFLFPLIVLSQHSIKGTFSPAEDYTWAVLYQIGSINKSYIAQSQVKNGSFEFKLGADIPKGMYKIVYNVPQEIHNFDVIYNAQEDIILNYSEGTNVEFISSEENNLLKNYTESMISIGDEIGLAYAQEKISNAEVKALFKKLSDNQDLHEEKATGSLALNFIVANKPYIPSKFEDAKTYIKNVKKNYFTHVDFNNPILQSSKFLIDRAVAYVLSMSTANRKGTLQYESSIDVINSQLKNTDPRFQKVYLNNIWHSFTENNMPEPANYLASTYLIPLATELKDSALAENLTLYKNLSKGNLAPNFSLGLNNKITNNAATLHDIDVANKYILVFWSSSCSHCLKEIPKLNERMKNFEKNEYKVIAIGLEDENSNWKSETYYSPDFIHVLALGKWENKIGKAYGIVSTPTYIILDKDKKILEKPQSFIELESLLKE